MASFRLVQWFSKALQNRPEEDVLDAFIASLERKVIEHEEEDEIDTEDIEVLQNRISDLKQVRQEWCKVNQDLEDGFEEDPADWWKNQ